MDWQQRNKEKKDTQEEGKRERQKERGRKGEEVEEEWWDCPICGRPQAASEREFNEHIDLCLSRQTIRDVVQETAESRSRDQTPVPKRAKMGNEKGRERGVGGDPKQRRLCFG